MSTSANTAATRTSTRYAPHEPSNVPIKTQYLLVYNIFSLVLWLSLFARIASSFVSRPADALYDVWPYAGRYALLVQSFAIAEVVHAALGVVRAPVLTTALQISSRLFLMWGICWMFGNEGLLQEQGKVWNAWERLKGSVGGVEARHLAVNQVVFLLMLIAWGSIDSMRYLYFVYSLGNRGPGQNIPKALTWWRYNAFFVLYPLGISCECWLVYNAIPFAMEFDVRYAYLLMAVLAIYVPGSYTLFTYMMRQRRKMIKGKQKERPH